GVKEYNDGVNALKNTEWLIKKIFEYIKDLLEWLGVRAKSEPSAQLAQSHDTIMALFQDSISATSAPSLDLPAARSNLAKAQSLLPLATAAKSNTHSHILTQSIKNYTNAIASQEALLAPPRPEPYVLYLYGKPGSGKSVFAQALARTLAYHLCGDPESVYAPSSSDCAYYDGYAQQCVHYIDDVGQDPEGKDWKDFAQLVSTSPFIVPMASLEKKGMLYNSKVIILTSNFSEPNPRASRIPQALQRRLKCMIEIEPLSCPTQSNLHTLSSLPNQFNPETALRVDGPATRYFANDCPMLRFEAFRLTSNHGFKHADDIVRHVLDKVKNSGGISNALAALIPGVKPLARQQ
nr:2C [Passerivirus A1]